MKKFKSFVILLALLFIFNSIVPQNIFSLAPQHVPIVFSELPTGDTLEQIKSQPKSESARALEITALNNLLANLERPDLADQYILSDLHGASYKTLRMILHILGVEKHTDIIAKLDARWKAGERPLIADILRQLFLKEGIEPAKIEGDLLGVIKERYSDVEIIFNGDIMDRGPEGLQTNNYLMQARELGLIKPGMSTTGNHDLWAYLNIVHALHLPWNITIDPDETYVLHYNFPLGAEPGFDQADLKLLYEISGGADAEERKYWWQRRLHEFNEEQDELQKKYKQRAKDVEELFKKHEKVIAARPEQEQRLWNDLRGNYFNTEVNAGFKGVGRMSLKWWKERQAGLLQIMQGLARESLYEAMFQYSMDISTLYTEVNNVIAALEKRYKEKVKNFKSKESLTYRVFESIMYGNYLTLEWWALDWSWHSGWGPSLMEEITNRLKARRKAVVAVKTFEELRRVETERLGGLDPMKFLRDKIALYSQMDIEEFAKEMYDFKVAKNQGRALSFERVNKIMRNKEAYREGVLKNLKKIRKSFFNGGGDLAKITATKEAEAIKLIEINRVISLTEADLRKELENRIVIGNEEFIKVNGANYLQEAEFKNLAQALVQEFKLFQITDKGDLITHGALPIEKDEQIGWTVKFEYDGVVYKGENIFSGLTILENDVKKFTLDEPAAYQRGLNALRLINSWYADASTMLKNKDLIRYAKGGWRTILKSLGITGKWYQGHNPFFSHIYSQKKKEGSFEQMISGEIVWVDHGVSPAYIDAGGYTFTNYNRTLLKFKRRFTDRQIEFLLQNNVIEIKDNIVYLRDIYAALIKDVFKAYIEKLPNFIETEINSEDLAAWFFDGISVGAFANKDAHNIEINPKIDAMDGKKGPLAEKYNVAECVIGIDADRASLRDYVLERIRQLDTAS